jgi:hypothetical protein
VQDEAEPPPPAPDRPRAASSRQIPYALRGLAPGPASA